MQGMNFKLLRRVGPLIVATALGVSVMAAPQVLAWGNEWDWCQRVSMKTAGNSVKIRGNCDGGKLKMSGRLSRRTGNFDISGYMGSTSVHLGGRVKNLVIIDGAIGYSRVDMDGSENQGSCYINGWIGDEYDNGHYGSMLGRICSLMSSNV